MFSGALDYLRCGAVDDASAPALAFEGHRFFAVRADALLVMLYSGDLYIMAAGRTMSWHGRFPLAVVIKDVVGQCLPVYKGSDVPGKTPNGFHPFLDLPFTLLFPFLVSLKKNPVL